jgi:FkbM family methyltransferase
MGVHSIFAGFVVKSVYSVEPHPVNLSYLGINKDLNDSDNVNIYSCGLSDKSDYFQLRGRRVGITVDGSASITERKDNFAYSEIYNIRVERGDNFLANNDLEPPTIIKIDAEGAEFSILKGLKGTISRPDCRLLYCETHSRNEDDIKDFLSEFGYSIKLLDNARIIKAEKK